MNLATGEHLYIPAPDISVYNPYGPTVVYQRNFFSKIAKEGVSSPGLPVKWIDGFDATMGLNNPAQSGTWKDLKLVYPNSAKEGPFTPVLDGGDPTGEFTEPTGCEYMVTGVASSTPGQWESITITFKDRAKWVFLPVATDTYMFADITNRMGRSINIVRDGQNRVSAVQDDQASPNTVTLLSFTYPSGTGTLLSSITDVYGRKVHFGYTDVSGTTCLTSVSQITTSSSGPAAAAYGYVLLGSSPARPHITSVSVPSPTGSGTSTQSYTYDSSVRVSSVTDANGNVEEFDYESPDATRVKKKNSQAVVEDERIVIFDPAHGNVVTGNVDVKGNYTQTIYGDGNNPELPTKLIDEMNRSTDIQYDDFGNITKTTTPRGTETNYGYSYPDQNNPDIFPLGRLDSVQEGSKTATTFSYYEPSGLVDTIGGPRPDGSNGLIASYTYDSLGNVLTVTKPGAPDSITTTFGYGETPKLGQPLTITDGLNHVTELTYDERGNVESKEDAEGNVTNIIYSIADQPTTVSYPATP